MLDAKVSFQDPSSSRLDWKCLKKQNQVPSFSLPSQFSGIRSVVPQEYIDDICSRFSQEQYNKQCQRESLVVPLLLSSNATSFGADAIRTHVEFSRQPLRQNETATTVFTSASSKDDVASLLGRAEVTGKIGSSPRNGTSAESLRKLQDLMPFLAHASMTSRQSMSGRWVPIAGRVPTPFTARNGRSESMCSEATSTLPTLVGHAEGTPSRHTNTPSSKAADSWCSTPIPQPSRDMLSSRFGAAKDADDVLSTATDECLKQALTLGSFPKRPKQGRIPAVQAKRRC